MMNIKLCLYLMELYVCVYYDDENSIQFALRISTPLKYFASCEVVFHATVSHNIFDSLNDANISL